jgi:hypothetical protein
MTPTLHLPASFRVDRQEAEKNIMENRQVQNPYHGIGLTTQTLWNALVSRLN